MIAGKAEPVASPFYGVFAAAGIPLLATVACSSDVTSLGRATYGALQGHECRTWFLVALGLCLLGFLLDLQRWSGALHLAAYINNSAIAVTFFIGCVFYANTAPSMLIVIGMAFTLLAVFVFRRLVMPTMATQTFMHGTSLAFGLYSLVLAVGWVLWAWTELLGGYNEWGSEADADLKRRHLTLTRFILWCSPLIIACSCLLICLFSLLRGQIHAPAQHVGCDVMESQEEGDSVFIARELRMVLALLGLLVLFLWVAASLAVEDMDLSNTVLRLSGAMAVFIATYFVIIIGRTKLWKTAEEVQSVRLLLDFFQSDWARGIFLTFAWPLLPLYFALEMVHQQLRRLLQAVGIQGEDGSAGCWTTKEASAHWNDLQQWNKVSVLTKSTWFGILYFSLQVGISQGVKLFLAWLRERIASWPLLAILCVLFAIGMLMFALPPVPGLPIYVIAGLVIVQRCEEDGYGFAFGCTLAVAFSFLLKLSGVLMQQKGIGEPFSDSVEVKKLVAIHTPPMKAVRHILSRQGLDTAKVAVLVGGPDWPTSVLTGILKLRSSQMLIGSSPIIFLIAPVVLAGAFTLKAAAVENVDGSGSGEAARYRSIANVMTMFSSLVLVGMMLVAGYYIEEIQHKFKQEIDQGRWEVDPQEIEVVKSLARDAKESDLIERIACWSAAPPWLQALLYLGSIFSSVVIYIAFSPICQPFEEFSVSSRIADLPDNSILGLVRQSGWIAIYSCGGAVMCLLAFFAWRRQQVKGLVDFDEAERLAPVGPPVLATFRPAPPSGQAVLKMPSGQADSSGRPATPPSSAQRRELTSDTGATGN